VGRFAEQKGDFLQREVLYLGFVFLHQEDLAQQALALLVNVLHFVGDQLVQLAFYF
jgi:hypothetical protein